MASRGFGGPGGATISQLADFEPACPRRRDDGFISLRPEPLAAVGTPIRCGCNVRAGLRRPRLVVVLGNVENERRSSGRRPENATTTTRRFKTEGLFHPVAWPAREKEGTLNNTSAPAPLAQQANRRRATAESDAWLSPNPRQGAPETVRGLGPTQGPSHCSISPGTTTMTSRRAFTRWFTRPVQVSCGRGRTSRRILKEINEQARRARPAAHRAGLGLVEWGFYGEWEGRTDRNGLRCWSIAALPRAGFATEARERPANDNPPPAGSGASTGRTKPAGFCTTAPRRS